MSLAKAVPVSKGSLSSAALTHGLGTKRVDCSGKSKHIGGSFFHLTVYISAGVKCHLGFWTFLIKVKKKKFKLIHCKAVDPLQGNDYLCLYIFLK